MLHHQSNHKSDQCRIIAYLDYRIVCKQAAGVVASGLHLGDGSSMHGGGARIVWGAKQSLDDSAEGGGRRKQRGWLFASEMQHTITAAPHLPGGFPRILDVAHIPEYTAPGSTLTQSCSVKCVSIGYGLGDNTLHSPWVHTDAILQYWRNVRTWVVSWIGSPEV